MKRFAWLPDEARQPLTQLLNFFRGVGRGQGLIEGIASLSAQCRQVCPLRISHQLIGARGGFLIAVSSIRRRTGVA